MRELPSGTVTFLFTDVEGSTRLLQKLGRELYVRALTEHRRLLRDRVAAHGGVEVEMQGDSFHFVFPSAREAVAAAAAVQRALAQHPWEAEPVRVRMGLHTGEPMQADGLYAGLDVHRAARVMSAGHGGQVVLSARTADLVEGELPEGVALRYLGEHRLKDLLLPQPLYDLVVEGLPEEFAPPETLENRPTNLPVQPTPLIGRERELTELQTLLLHPDVRLLTLTGPGGTGKTRLALQLAAEVVERFPDGVWFVNLAALTDPSLVLPTLAQTLAVKEEGGRPLVETLAEQLAGKASLLVLDNFEHVAEAAESLAVLLARARSVKLLVTSRVSLHLSTEHQYPVPALAAQEALTVFTERARAAKPSFSINGNRPVIVEICRRLDHLPLAIELAAARINLLPERALLDRLNHRLKLLTGGARDQPARQQTLRAAIDWSYDLLPADEQTLFRRLAVFAGGRTLEAMEAVCNPEGELDVFEIIASLVDKNLLRREEGEEGEPRFVMLETIHEYARERLHESGEATQISERHAHHFLLLAEQAAPVLRHGGSDQKDWLARLETEHDNLRAALTTYATSGRADQQVRLAAALGEFWIFSGLWREGEQAIEQALAASDEQNSTRVEALMTAAIISRSRGDNELNLRFAQEALALAEALEDDYWQACALKTKAIALAIVGDAFAIPLLEKSLALFTRLGDASGIASALENLGVMALDRKNHMQARGYFEQSLQSALLREDRFDAASTLMNLGLVSFYLHDLADARSHFLESLRLGSGLKDLVAWNFEGLAAVEAAANDAERAVRLLGSAEAIWHEIGGGLGEAERPMHDAAVDQARAALGESRFAALHAEGRALAFEEALAYARSERSERNDQSTS